MKEKKTKKTDNWKWQEFDKCYIGVDPIKNCPWQNNLFGQILVKKKKDWSW